VGVLEIESDEDCQKYLILEIKMQKDKTIRKFISRLTKYFDPQDYNVVDNAPVDLMSICITNNKHDDREVYISTFSLPHGRYYYNCDVVKISDDEVDLETLDAGESVNFDKILQVIEKHLGLKRILEVSL
jgi:hypothetical protein